MQNRTIPHQEFLRNRAITVFPPKIQTPVGLIAIVGVHGLRVQ